ncbi:hypothetical protein CVT26_000819 [Gymnopilus dilepis]|uniref:Uncharacterized protein n=1 Tax=Gymnopilus dilepis TaxID=231916 RepID=A0A409YLI5_9AGAR|nr:hypothetical protein CVT26_000819 [Gymnopilus dilepis]
MASGKRVTLTLHSIHTPDLVAILVSIGRFDKAGFTVTFGGGKVVFRDPDGDAILHGRGSDGIYLLDMGNDTTSSGGYTTSLAFSARSQEKPHPWRLGIAVLGMQVTLIKARNVVFEEGEIHRTSDSLSLSNSAEDVPEDFTAPIIQSAATPVSEKADARVGNEAVPTGVNVLHPRPPVAPRPSDHQPPL